ncbi:rho GTPase-activating protein 33-like [Hippocampus comes]|uniref:Rho GTPase-activating protein 33-like n=1 Tax=Hippocampus comes TaxID=109280 RepID=A0A3Q3DYU9_HIPCM|nr:PREDICTED: rho GTPase-activating protein 33-like [Hippocampus comes]
MKSRPPPQKLRQRGILRERVFGCDLGEHLHSSEHEVPQVVKSCAEFIEKHGVVDGIYRLSGISSNIQKLRFGLLLDDTFLSSRIPFYQCLKMLKDSAQRHCILPSFLHFFFI